MIFKWQHSAFTTGTSTVLGKSASRWATSWHHRTNNHLENSVSRGRHTDPTFLHH